jgi:hypothetical protein
VEVLVSVWSVEPDDPDCCAARTVTLLKISSMATARANRTPLLNLIWLSPSARDWRAALSALTHVRAESRGLSACLADVPSWNARIMAKKQNEVKVKWERSLKVKKTAETFAR